MNQIPIQKKPKAPQPKVEIAIQKKPKIQPAPVWKPKTLPLDHLVIIDNSYVDKKFEADHLFCNLSSNYVDWSFKDILIRIRNHDIDDEVVYRLNQYFYDYNQKRMLYPYQWFFDQNENDVVPCFEMNLPPKSEFVAPKPYLEIEVEGIRIVKY